LGISYPHSRDPTLAAATIRCMRQLPEQRESCKEQISTLEPCVLPGGIEKGGAEVTFRESAEGGIRCAGCADVERAR
jgi:hypothetical protein